MDGAPGVDWLTNVIEIDRGWRGVDAHSSRKGRDEWGTGSHHRPGLWVDQSGPCGLERRVTERSEGISPARKAARWSGSPRSISKWSQVPSCRTPMFHGPVTVSENCQTM